MGPEKLFALWIIFAVLSLALSLPAPREMHYNGGALGSLKKLCKSVCAEAKGSSKFHDASLTCFCEIPKTTTGIAANLLTKKAQENGMTLKIIKRNSNAKRETNELLDDEASLNTAKKRSPSDFDNVLGQAALNTVPQRHHQSDAKVSGSTEVSSQRPLNISNRKTAALSEMESKDMQIEEVFPKKAESEGQRQHQNGKGSAPLESTGVSNQRPPNTSNKETSALTEVVKEMELEAPNLNKEANAKNMPDEKVSLNKANKRQMPSQFDSDDFLGHAPSNKERQQQNEKGSGEVSSQKPSNISNKKTSASSDLVKEAKPEAPSAQRQIDVQHVFDDEVPQNTATHFENTLGQALPNTDPQRQQQNAKGSSLAESVEVSSQRPPSINNKKTSALPDVKKEVPNLKRGRDEDSQVSLNAADKRQAFSSFDLDLGQASPKHQHHRQKASESPKGEVASSSNQRPPNISNKKTSALPKEETLSSTEIREAKSLVSPGHTMRRSTSNLKEMNKLQDNGVGLKRNPNLERGINLENPSKSSDSEDVVGQASPKTTPQQQNTKGSVLPEANRPPNVNSKITSALSEGLANKKLASATTENFVGASSDLLVNMVGEGEPISSSRQTTRRSTPSPRKPPALRRPTYNSEPIRRALESARVHIDTLIQRANQPSFNPSTVGAEIEAICASLRSVTHRVNESSRNLERSALMEQIRERERERHARIHSRFGGHEDRPRKLKPLLVGAANPKDKAGVGKTTEEPQGKKDKQKEAAQKGSTIITQPPELIED